MSKLLGSILTFGAILASGSALPSSEMDLLESRATSSNYSLFAYGSSTDTEIGGFPIIYYDGLAYIADPAKVNQTMDYVVFKTNSTQLIANPLTLSTATWSESLFYITVGYGPTGFYKEGVSNISTSTIKTTGFKFYGTTAMINIDGTLETLWYAVATAVDGLWSVGWNATGAGEDSAELLSLRKAAAPNVDYPSK
ncbi:hypothetical protein N0V82_005985 [Gnomoniopsis sp. IMI 355080]|nr:hypothetical protein N0V82_005985 [Gnomoniopsis sp. IMI 355080]